ncbi:hypothetical protein JRQ81_000871 [Phrynocephalus forsythii]|uniref:D-aminoacyl-tRNA deacylase n=1 Tax=Phrynocephalus forsythii TaxID=171643 RepID=A0A9Q0Y8J0_9SAUR|nr:hypothetical protein JRQ81_000871 [Phrynocephalus forsythii]
MNAKRLCICDFQKRNQEAPSRHKSAVTLYFPLPSPSSDRAGRTSFYLFLAERKARSRERLEFPVVAGGAGRRVAMADGSRGPLARTILQQCLHARLQVKPAEPGSEAQWVEVIAAGAKPSVNTLMNVKLSENEDGKYVSVLDLPGSLLIIPQATLGGRLKGRSMQYHANIEKDSGMELYSQFVFHCERELSANAKCFEAGAVVRHGTYGNRQVLKVDTNGPFTHMIEF